MSEDPKVQAAEVKNRAANAATARKASEDATKKTPKGPRVAEGKAITSKRGMLDCKNSGIVTPSDFGDDGAKRIEQLLEKGVLVKG